MNYALISVSDKTNVVMLARALVTKGVGIFSSGGTHQALQAAGIDAVDVSDYTGVPEMMQGRVKTLHPKVHGGILARRGLDEQVMQDHDIKQIDLVVVNLYPFAAVTKRHDVSLVDAIENIDIGGPALIRSAAKNHASVTVLTDPNDYQAFIDSWLQGDMTETARARYAVKAFRHTSAYDALIYSYLNSQYDAVSDLAYDDFLLYGRTHMHADGTQSDALRYGENPNQHARLYTNNRTQSLPLGLTQVQGVPLSYNNWVDVESAYKCVRQLPQPACVIVKHATPCGAAVADTSETAYRHAFQTDATSAFGGIVALNRPLTSKLLSEIIATQFVEIIIATSLADAEATTAIAAQKPKLRILLADNTAQTQEQLNIHMLSGGFLVQEAVPEALLTPELVRHVAGPQLAIAFTDCALAWHLVTWVKSNAIVLVKNGMTIGIGCGQPNRVRSVDIAIENAINAGFDLAGSVLASDAFFPFRDSIDRLAHHKLAAVIQPSGSIRDQEVQDAANQHGISLLFTNTRVFRH